MLHVIYDGRCGFCTRCVRVLRALDWLRQLRCHDGSDRPAIVAQFSVLAAADLDAAMWTVDPCNRAQRGFFAFRAIAWRMPLTVLLAPLLHLPGIPWLGTRAYAVIARHRYQLGCNTESCRTSPTGRASR